MHIYISYAYYLSILYTYVCYIALVSKKMAHGRRVSTSHPFSDSATYQGLPNPTMLHQAPPVNNTKHEKQWRLGIFESA